MPSRPCSPAVLTLRVRKGVGRSAPAVVTTRRLPFFSQMNSLPSGANSIATGRLSPVTKVASLKPAGTTARSGSRGAPAEAVDNNPSAPLRASAALRIASRVTFLMGRLLPASSFADRSARLEKSANSLNGRRGLQIRGHEEQRREAPAVLVRRSDPGDRP